MGPTELGVGPSLTVVYPYYDNPEMLCEHQRIWRALPGHIARRVEYIVVDDASPRWPAEAVFTDAGVRASLYRIENDIPWNWLEARNIGAKHALADWLILTDIDHAVPERTLGKLLHGLESGWLAEGRFYTFERVDAPHETPYKPHPDSYLMPRALYWQAGGYDEYFAGHYGTSGIARRRFGMAGHRERLDLPLVRYPREVIADASTTTLKRKDGRTPGILKRLWEERAANGITEPMHFRQPYRQIAQYPC